VCVCVCVGIRCSVFRSVAAVAVGPEPFECEVCMTGTSTRTQVCVYMLQCVAACCSMLL